MPTSTLLPVQNQMLPPPPTPVPHPSKEQPWVLSLVTERLGPTLTAQPPHEAACQLQVTKGETEAQEAKRPAQGHPVHGFGPRASLALQACPTSSRLSPSVPPA